MEMAKVLEFVLVCLCAFWKIPDDVKDVREGKKNEVADLMMSEEM